MSPIEEGFSNSEFNRPGKKTIEDKISAERDYLLKDLNENIKPLIKDDNTQIIRKYLGTLRDKAKKRVGDIPLYKIDELTNSIHDLQEFLDNVQEIEDALPELNRTSSEVRAMLPQWENAIKTGEVEQEFLNAMNTKLFETSKIFFGVLNKIENLSIKTPLNLLEFMKGSFYFDGLKTAEKAVNYGIKYRGSSATESRSSSINSLKEKIKDLKAFDQKNQPHNSAEPKVTGVGLEGERVASPPVRAPE